MEPLNGGVTEHTRKIFSSPAGRMKAEQVFQGGSKVFGGGNGDPKLPHG